MNPLALRARQIVDELGISIVVGGAATVSEFIPVADTVLSIENHRVTDSLQTDHGAGHSN